MNGVPVSALISSIVAMAGVIYLVLTQLLKAHLSTSQKITTAYLEHVSESNKAVGALATAVTEQTETMRSHHDIMVREHKEQCALMRRRGGDRSQARKGD